MKMRWISGALIISYLCLSSHLVLAQASIRPSSHTRESHQDTYHTPKPGSVERKAIMDAHRVPVEKELGVKVIFVVNGPDSLRVVRDWAFVNAEFRHPNGKRLRR